MRELQIFILDLQGNQLGELELTDSDDFALKLSKSLASINDIGRRNTSYSLDFEAPQTKNNNKLLSGLRFATATKEVLGKKPCAIMVDGNQFDTGFLYAYESTYDGMYRLNFKGDNNDWVERLRDVELNELNWRDYSSGLRTVDATEYFTAPRVNTLNTKTSVDADLIYPLINRNNNGTFEPKRPQLHLRAIILAMFEKIGYTVNSSFLESHWIKGSEVITYNDEFGNPYKHLGLSIDPSFQMKRDPEDVEGELIQYKSLGITTSLDPTTWDSATMLGNLGTPSSTNFRTLYRFPNLINTSLTDNFGRFDTSTSEFTVGTSGKYDLEFNFEFEFGWWDLSTAFNWRHYTGQFVSYEHPPSFKWYVVKNNTSDIAIDGAVIFEGSATSVNSGNEPQGNIQILTNSHDFVGGDKISVFLELEENSEGHVLGWLNTPNIITLANPGSMQYWRMRIANNSELKIVPKEDITSGDTFRINSHIPDGIKCLELLQDFKTMFNLYFDVDVNRKQVLIETRDDFYTGNVVDITNKIDLNTDPKLNYLTKYKNEMVFEYAIDSKDKYLEHWNKINDITYGQYKYLFNNNERFEKGQSKLSTSLISATIQGNLENDVNYPEITSIVKEQYFDKDNLGKPTNRNYNMRVFQLVSGQQFDTAGISRRGGFVDLVQLVGIMENYANTPTLDDRKLTFIGERGLVWDYYRKTLANIEDTTVLTLKVNISLYEYYNWNLRDVFHISAPAEIAGYYITDSIKNFNVTKETMTSVSLVKFKDFEPVTVTGGGGNVNVLTTNTPQPQEIMCTVNGVIVSCLDNNLDKMYKI